jgi:copper(I)-binding protein
MRKLSHLVAAIGMTTLFCCSSASAQEIKAGDLVLERPWSRATPAGSQVGAGYLIITNKGASADRLVAAATPAAGRVEIHEMAMQNDVMTMRPLPGGLPIEPGKQVALAPGGYHIMFMELKAPFKQGDKIPVTLEFQKAGKVQVTFDVQAVGAQSPAHGH